MTVSGVRAAPGLRKSSRGRSIPFEYGRARPGSSSARWFGAVDGAREQGCDCAFPGRGAEAIRQRVLRPGQRGAALRAVPTESVNGHRNWPYSSTAGRPTARLPATLVELCNLTRSAHAETRALTVQTRPDALVLQVVDDAPVSTTRRPPGTPGPADRARAGGAPRWVDRVKEVP